MHFVDFWMHFGPISIPLTLVLRLKIKYFVVSQFESPFLISWVGLFKSSGFLIEACHSLNYFSCINQGRNLDEGSQILGIRPTSKKEYERATPLNSFSSQNDKSLNYIQREKVDEKWAAMIKKWSNPLNFLPLIAIIKSKLIAKFKWCKNTKWQGHKSSKWTKSGCKTS